MAYAGLILTGCDEAIPAPEKGNPLPPFDASLCSAADVSAPSISIDTHVTGETNNRIRRFGDHLWVTHSGDNTVGRFDLVSGELETEFADIGNDRSPQDVYEHQGVLYVTNLLGSVVVVDAELGDVRGELEDLNSATGVFAYGDHLLVAQTGYDSGVYSNGRLSRYQLGEDLPTFVESISPGINTGSLTYAPQHELLIVTSTGELGYDNKAGAFIPAGDGSISLFDVTRLEEGLENAETRRTSIPRSSEDIFAGAPAEAAVLPDGSAAYIPSSTAPHLYKIELPSGELVRGTDNPIQAYIGEGNQLTHMQFRPDGIGYVLAFNQDALYLFDPSCDASVAGPFDLAGSADIAGPLSMAFDETGTAYILMTLSNSITTVKPE